MRRTFVKGLVGAHLSGLDHKGSDEDYIEILVPTLDDIATLNKFGDGKTGEVDLVQKDIRDFLKFMYHAKITFLDVLYSPIFEADDEMKPYLLELLDMREEIMSAALPNLYNAFAGVAKQRLGKANEAAQRHLELTDKEAYKMYKDYANSTYMSYLFVNYAAGGYRSYAEALNLTGATREILKDMKGGVIDYKQCKVIAQNQLAVLTGMGPSMLAHENEEKRLKVYNKMKDIVTRAMKHSFSLE